MVSGDLGVRPTVVVTGAGGLLGRALVRAGADRADLRLVPLTRAECDVCAADALASALERYTPSVMLNCAAYTNVDGAQTDIAAALTGNATGPAVLASACAAANVALLHVSTDHVFDGAASRPYETDDPARPLSVYGASKLAGEEWVRRLAPRHWIVRTAGLFGAGGRNFVDAIAGRVRRGEPLRVVADQVCDRTWADDLASALLALSLRQAPWGTYHLTNASSGSWYEFALAIAQQLGIEAAIEPVTSDVWGAPAPRPAWSVLSNRRWTDEGFAPLRDEREALAAYLAS